VKETNINGRFGRKAVLAQMMALVAGGGSWQPMCPRDAPVCERCPTPAHIHWLSAPRVQQQMVRGNLSRNMLDLGT
jgi:hypothetical protein